VERTPLRLVSPAPFRAPRAPFVLLSLLVVTLGLLGLLGLNTVVAEDAFTLHDLQSRNGALTEREAELRRELAQLESPSSLAARAGALGLVPAGDPVFLRRADGAVLGNAQPVQPPVVVRPPAPPAPAKTAQPSAKASARPGAKRSAPAAKKATTPAPQPKASGRPTPKPSTGAAP
jgi:cell division protein FtsB